ncbi:YraN family protein [Chitinophaga lutea]
MASHHDLGKKGEALAAAYLQLRQYRILHTNWTAGKREIDIIAEKEGTLVFVEVKTRTSQAYGMPEEAVGRQKTRQLQAAAERYLEQHAPGQALIRFDVVAITTGQPGEPEIVHFEDAF